MEALLLFVPIILLGRWVLKRNAPPPPPQRPRVYRNHRNSEHPVYGSRARRDKCDRP